MLVLGFSTGGYFAGGVALAAFVALLLLLVRLVGAADPLAGLTPGGLVAAVALAGLCAWTVASGAWSSSQSRSLAELDRVLGYTALLVLFAGLRDGTRSARLLLRATFAALAVLVAAGVLSRVAPGLLDVPTSRIEARLSWPLGYWNAFGLAGALTTLLGLHLLADVREPLPLRAVAGAVVPLACVGTYLSLSRGAIAAGLLGLAVLLVTRGVPALLALVAVAIPAAVATVVAYDAERLVSTELTSAATIAQGHRVAAVLAVTMVAAAILGLGAGRASSRYRRPGWATARRLRTATALVGLGLLGTGLALGAPSLAARQWDKLTEPGLAVPGPQARDRLQTVSANGRIDHWRVAVDALSASPLRGSGAGTYELVWDERRPIALDVRDAHSLYLETAAELGLVGALLLLVGLLAPVVLLLRRLRRDPIWAGVLAVVVTWLVHAGIDWDWEVPAVSLWLPAVLGAATAATGRGRRLRLPYLARMGVGLLLLATLVIPARYGLSQLELTRAAEAFRRGDCDGTIRHALEANDRLGVRPEPLVLLAFCDVRQNRAALARRLAAAAIERDPDEWSLRYAAALVAGATGQDPRPMLRSAVDANPREPRAADLLEAVDDAPRRSWPGLARNAPLPLLQPRRGRPR